MKYLIPIILILLLLWLLPDRKPTEPKIEPVVEKIEPVEVQLGGKTTEQSAGEEVMMSL